MRGATTSTVLKKYTSIFQSTHPVRGATKCPLKITKNMEISIHAPRAGCDARQSLRRLLLCKFQSTHPVRGATQYLLGNGAVFGFQSTHPVRGATRSAAAAVVYATDFNPRTPCGVRRLTRFRLTTRENFNPRTPCGVRLQHGQPGNARGCISIHAPRAGCDLKAGIRWWQVAISIHAPRAGCDRMKEISGLPARNFNPRTPCGVRPT